MTARSAQRPARGRSGLIRRLTGGWNADERTIGLAGHTRLHGELPAIRNRQASRLDLIEQVNAAGLTGRGGAAFPTATKMRAVAARRGSAVLVANGLEGEPLSRKDQILLSRSPHLVLDGIELAAVAVGATTAHLCLPQHRTWLEEIVTEAIAQRQHERADTVPVEVRQVPDRYVSSEETALVHWLNGGLATPTATPPRPFERGVGRRPTLVANLETLAHIALIGRHGATWFRETGTADAPGTMLTTVAGAVAEPGVYEIAGGTKIGTLLAAARTHSRAGAVLVGGYSGSWHPISQIASLPYTKSQLARAGAAPGPGILFALAPGACGIAETARILRYLADGSAGQCGPCMFGLPAIARDLSELADGRATDDPLGRLRRRFRQIAGRGACRLPDGAVRMAESALSSFAADARAHARSLPCLAARDEEARS